MIFFVFQSADADALRATGIGEAGPFEYVAHGGMLFGFMLAGNYRTRMHIDRLHPKLMSLPGPGGSMTAAHASALTGEVMAAGTPIKTLLASIYAATAHEGFNPNNL